MAKAFADLSARADCESLTHDEWLALLLEREATYRQDRRPAHDCDLQNCAIKPRPKTSSGKPRAVFADSGPLRPSIPGWASTTGSNMDVGQILVSSVAGIPRWTSASLARRQPRLLYLLEHQLNALGSVYTKTLNSEPTSRLTFSNC